MYVNPTPCYWPLYLAKPGIFACSAVSVTLISKPQALNPQLQQPFPVGVIFLKDVFFLFAP